MQIHSTIHDARSRKTAVFTNTHFGFLHTEIGHVTFESERRNTDAGKTHLVTLDLFRWVHTSDFFDTNWTANFTALRPVYDPQPRSTHYPHLPPRQFVDYWKQRPAAERELARCWPSYYRIVNLRAISTLTGNLKIIRKCVPKLR